jgi:hypothetical protein
MHDHATRSISLAPALRTAANVPVQSSELATVKDPLEHQVEMMVDRVLRMPEPFFVQRKCAACEEEEMIRRKPAHSFLQQRENNPAKNLQGGSQVIRRSPLSLAAELTWTTTIHNKGSIFSFLRVRSPTADADLVHFIDSIFPLNTDDSWLAHAIMRNGPEPLWPLTDIQERQRRASANAWLPEPGNIRGVIGTGSHSVEAFYFRGTSDRRALIIGGVHGSEPGGVEVVHDLLELLRSPAAPMPFFSVIIVPELFAANIHASRKQEDRRASLGSVGAMVSGAATSVPAPDPNRQFPAIGNDPATDPTLNCVVDEQQRCIEPENLALLDIIHRFQPERVASVHGHSAQTNTAALLAKGGPSITTDPRPGQVVEDQNLTLAMALEAQRLGVRIPGNFMGTARQTTTYPTGTAPAMSKGLTLGQWGSHATSTRPAMNIILIETFGNATSATARTAALRKARKTELMNLAQVLRNFFLTDPALLPAAATSGSPGGTTP